MKRTIIALLTALALVFTTFGALAQSASIDDAEAIRIATELVKKQTGISDEELGKLHINTWEGEAAGVSGLVKVVEFRIELSNLDTVVYSVTVESHGSVIEANIREDAMEAAVNENEGWAAVAKMEEKYGEMYFWPMQETVELYDKYFGGGYKMPGEGDLSMDDAVAIAKKYAIDAWGLTQEYLDGLPVHALLEISEDANIGSFWRVYFVDDKIRSTNDGILSPHMVMVDNPEGTVLGGWMGDTNGNG